MESGGGRRYVASEMSNGRRGCDPVAAKYGEQPIRLRTVTRSAQNTVWAHCDHRFSSPSAALTSDCLTSK
jgi:hypothetical protein